MKLKWYHIIIFGWLLPLSAQAQNNPLFDTYFTNNYLINPAITGIDPFPEFQLTYRCQWGCGPSGIDGAPRTMLMSFHTSLGNPFSLRSFTGKQPGKAIPYPRNSSFQKHSGLGFMAYRDQIGIFQTTHIAPSFARHLPLSRKVQLSLGFSAGIRWQSIDQSLLNLADPNDPLINRFNNESQAVWTLGTLISSDRWFAGASASINSTTRANQYMMMLGKKIAHPTFYLTYQPFVLVRYNSQQQLNGDLGLKVEFSELIFLGGLVRTTKDASVFVGANFKQNRMGFTASYNTGVGEENLSNLQNNTIEFSVIFRLTKGGFLPCKTTPTY